MKIPRLLAAMLCAPILLITFLGAAEDDKKAPAETATKKPTLTYYYLDG